MERMRKITVESKSGGKPCDSTTETVTCGDDACDTDCKLAEWAPWSPCSKACGVGFQMRGRHIKEAATGTGTCADPESPMRQEYQRCNPQECKPTHGDTLRCVAEVDLVVILDGSSSIGAQGWEATKKLGKALVQQFDTGEHKAQVAVLVMSGPTEWSNYKKCTGNADSVDLLNDCKLVWVSHFTTDTTSVADEIGRLVWPKGSTLTSAALALTGAELRNGRQSAQSVVVAVTDGKALNPRRTSEAARNLREQARLILVPITSNACVSDIKSWASKPLADNVLAVRNYDHLDEVANVNRIMAEACSVVE